MLDNEEYSHGRRRSVDVGGLALALENQGLGHGWGGWEEDEQGETRYAELLSDMYNHTQTTVSHRVHDISPIVIPAHTRAHLIKSLDSWHFEPQNLPEEEVLFCAQILFESLFRIEHMREDIGVSLDDISVFLKHLQPLYCGHNSYHNFQHAVDVMQASQAFLCAAGVVPPVSILLDSDNCTWRPNKMGKERRLAFDLNNTCLFALYIVAIGHDVGHPGLTNMFMKNAKAPLSDVYDNKSALEQMHCALLIQAMRQHGLGKLLDRPDSGFRKMLAGIVLATDMSVHYQFIRDFQSLVDGREYSLDRRRLLLCQAIIKCADISNPSRPPGVSHYWANALMAEWTYQASLEKRWSLPPSVTPSECALDQVRGQIFFIGSYAKPLMDLVAQAVPEMEIFACQCTANLAMWVAREEVLSSSSAEDSPCPPVVIPSLRPPNDFITSFPLTLPAFVLTADEPLTSGEWHTTYPPSDSSSSSDFGSDVHVDPLVVFPSLSPPASPVPSVCSSYAPAPRSSSSSLASNTSDATQAMRAAYSASVRKKKSFHHRYSWNVSINSGSSTCISSPPPLLATTPKTALLLTESTASNGSTVTSVTAVVSSPVGGENNGGLKVP
ncbi:HD-domain/PDEase-like protein [Suillus hirtellus]|nr:HD-domain/PDEase-like protein [Suillus hirtellus]